jgi:hypothetical protein
MTTQSITNSIKRSPCWRAFLLIPLVLACFALSQTPNAFGVSPAPDGGYANQNTAEGTGALFSLTTGEYNTALGFFSLRSDTTGSFNTALGAGTLLANTADQNTATGAGALLSNTTGGFNTADGAFALFSNTEGDHNTANGSRALFSNTTGSFNSAFGSGALASNTTSGGNTAFGSAALNSNSTGNSNTANGVNALVSNTDGSFNTANGRGALYHNTSGSNNTALGYQAGIALTTGDNNIDIGFNVGGVADESNTIRIGSTDITATYIRGISGQTAAGGAAVFVNSDGKLGTTTSSARFKDEIKPMGKASEAILALRPVSFRYKKELDPDRIPQFGLVAEEVEKVNPDLVVCDKDGKPYTVRYEAVNAMLLNEFLKEHRKVQEQQATITQLKSGAAKQEATISELKSAVGTLAASVKAQAVQVQKVSAQLEMSNPALRRVVNNQ